MIKIDIKEWVRSLYIGRFFYAGNWYYWHQTDTNVKGMEKVLYNFLKKYV